MICFKDKTFCSSSTCRNECGRKFTERDRIEAEEWWGGNDPPIAFSPFCDEDGNVVCESCNGKEANDRHSPDCVCGDCFCDECGKHIP